MPTGTVKAFAPAAISSFFEICDQTGDGMPIENLEQIGSRGGGFGLQKGVLTKVKVCPSKNSSIQVTINGQAAPEAVTTKAVTQELLSRARETCQVFIDHTIEVPIGIGFGTSAGGGLTSGLALADALGLALTFNQIGKIAHIADVKCKTGLGTVTPLTYGGTCMLVLEPGAPGIGKVDRIILDPTYVLVAGIVKTTAPKSVLSNSQKHPEIKCWGRKTLDKILEDPSIENFMACCWEFAQKTGFATEKVKQLVDLAEKAGAVGAAQNMIGEVVHAVVKEKNADHVAEAFKQVLPRGNVFVSKLEMEGARLVT